MGLIKLLKVGGADYPLREPPHTIAGVQFWGAAVERNGQTVQAYARLRDGPFSFMVPRALQGTELK